MTRTAEGKPTICILFLTHAHLWRFVSTEAFRELQQDYELRYMINDFKNISLDKAAEYGITVDRVLPLAPRRKRMVYRYLNLTVFRYAKRVEGFRMKTLRFHPVKRIPYQLLSLPPFYQVIDWSMKTFWPKWPELEAYLDEVKPALVIEPTFAGEPWTIELVNTTRRMGIPSLLLITSWDNLVSKGVIPIPPAWLGVWGEQNVKHAVEIQRVPKERVLVLGFPHAEVYFHRRVTPEQERADVDEVYELNGIPRDKRILLFAACAAPFDDMWALGQLDEAIEQGRYPDHVVLYRPHPWMMNRVGERHLRTYGFKHVYLDENMRETYDARFDERGDVVVSRIATDKMPKAPEIGYFPKLMSAVDGMINPLSTIAVEGALVRVPCVLICYSDPKNRFMPPNRIARYEHIRDILTWPGMIPVHEVEDLLPSVDRLLQVREDAETLDRMVEATRYVVYRDERTYGERLREAVGRILAG